MKDQNDKKTMDLAGELKRGRGRPAGESPALTPAERQKARTERLRASGRDFLKVELPLDLIEALDRFAAGKDRAKVETKSQVVERALRFFFRKR